MGNVFYIILMAVTLIGCILIIVINFDIGDKLFERKRRRFAKRVKFYSDDALVDMLDRNKHQYWKRYILRNELIRRGKNK